MNIQDLKDLICTSFDYKIALKKYTINHKMPFFSVSDMQLINIEGREYIVFFYQGVIVKIHRYFRQKIYALEEENVKSLISLQTKRILLPKEPVYDDEGNISGYTMSPILNWKEITTMSMETFLNENNLIDEDLEYLSESFVKLDDIRPHNTLYNGKLYFIDSGRFKRITNEKERTKEEYELIRQRNIAKYNEFVCDYLLYALMKGEKKEHKTLYKIKEYLLEYASLEKQKKLIDVIKKDCNKESTLLEYAKDLKKKAF